MEKASQPGQPPARTVSLIPTIPRPPRLRRVAAYARVSLDNSAMLHSLAAQVSHYKERITRHPGWEFAGVYADQGLLGTKVSRPEFQRLLADCREHKIDLILVKSISRFARNTVTLLEAVRELSSLGVEVWFERENIQSLSGDGEILSGDLVQTDNCGDRLESPCNQALCEFASAEGKLGGEFYTPSCVVRTLVEMIEPFDGQIYDANLTTLIQLCDWETGSKVA